MKFYRVAISDVDSTGDGLNDWEAYALGWTPFNAYSNGQQDANGNAMTDYAYATNLLASQNVVTISAGDPTAMEPRSRKKFGRPPESSPSHAAVFLLNAASRSILGPGGFGDRPCTAGVDYSNNLPASVTLPAGMSSTNLTLIPLANTNLTALGHRAAVEPADRRGLHGRQPEQRPGAC